jgi:hypothetical protein
VVINLCPDLIALVAGLQPNPDGVPLAHEFGGHMSPVLQDWTRKSSAGTSGSRRNDNFTPRLHVLRASA